MVETESILNSRPLTNVAEQPDNEEPLTPNHFLIQRPFNSLPPGQFGDQQPASLDEMEKRVVKVKTAYGTFVRPVSGLARVFSP